MKILAIESSCDETAAAVVENGRTVLSNIVASQVEEHKRYGGVVPEIAGRRHAEAISTVVRQAIEEGGKPDAVAVTYAPGLIGALLVGVNYAKGLAYAADLPLIPVHHLRSHIAANYLSDPAPKPPFLSLVVSGGNTHLVVVRDYTQFEMIGRTRDDAVGECFDKCARAMGLPYPGGVHLDKLAQGGDPHAFSLPSPHVEGSRFDFSFSGLKTAVLNQLHKAEQRGETVNLPDLAASVRHTATKLLCERAMDAMDYTELDTIVLAGGVSANSELRQRLQKACQETGKRLFMPPLSLCGDNAAMVGAQAYYEYQAGYTADMSLNAYATCPIDQAIYLQS